MPILSFSRQYWQTYPIDFQNFPRYDTRACPVWRPLPIPIPIKNLNTHTDTDSADQYQYGVLVFLNVLVMVQPSKTDPNGLKWIDLVNINPMDQHCLKNLYSLR